MPVFPAFRIAVFPGHVGLSRLLDGAVLLGSVFPPSGLGRLAVVAPGSLSFRGGGGRTYSDLNGGRVHRFTYALIRA